MKKTKKVVASKNKYQLPEPSSKYGYTREELVDICRARKIHVSKFWKAFGVNTCALIEGKPRYYKCDVERALYILGEQGGKYHMWD